MALNVNLQSLQVPFGTEFPGTVQALLDLIAQYMEIAGLEDFNGVNYGVTEPAAEDRDKAWFKTDGSGVPLGWYTWNGSAWAVLPAKATVGTLDDRDAILVPQEGQLFHLVGTGLYTYVDTAWEASFPAAAEQATFDRNYFFDSYQSLASFSGAAGSWTAIDLGSYIADAGLTAIKGAYISIDCEFPDQGFGGGGTTYEVVVRVSGDNTSSTSSNALLRCMARSTRDDSRASGAGQNSGVVPVASDTIYYAVSVANASGVQGHVWLNGFIY